jgi:hypothetical protein
METWSNGLPAQPGFYWAKARFLGPGDGSPEPVRVELNSLFGLSWEDFAREQALRAPEHRVPVEWVFQVYVFGSDAPYTLGDIDVWGPAITPG